MQRVRKLWYFLPPHAGLPYKDKFTLFWTREDFEDSENVGFLKLDDDRYLVRDSNTQVFESGIRDERDERMLDGFVAMITAVEKDYPGCLHTAHDINR